MKEQLSRLINSHKRIDTIDKLKKKRMSVTLWKYTGRSIVKTIEYFYSDLKTDLDIIFKPVKKFTKNTLKELTPLLYLMVKVIHHRGVLIHS